MKIQAIKFPAAQLKQLPQPVAIFTIAALDFANELSFLIKALLASMPRVVSDNDWELSLKASQTLFYAEIAAGKLYELWLCIEKQYHGGQVSRDYHSRLDEGALNGYKSLKLFFSDSNNIIKQIRRDYAFHSDQEEIKKALLALPDDTDCRVLITPSFTNTFFEFASGIVHKGLLSIIDDSLYPDRMDFIQKVIVPILMDALKFTHGFSVLALQDLQYETLTIAEIEPPKSNDLELPFFIER